MKSCIKKFHGLILLCIVFFPLVTSASVHSTKQALFKVALGSAYYFDFPGTNKFQFGPSLSLKGRLYKSNSVAIDVEQLYCEEQSYERHHAKRTAVVDLQWIRYLNQGLFGIGYVLTPSKNYYLDKKTYLRGDTMSVGLLGLSGSLIYNQHPVTAGVNAKFSNSDVFKTGSEFMYYIDASITLRLLKSLSFSLLYWRWYNTSRYDHVFQSAIVTQLTLSWNKFFIDLGPAFSINHYPSSYRDIFIFHGRIGYAHPKRKKKND